MSIRIQRCHPQVHLTHIDFTVTHSLKRFPEAKTLSFSLDGELDLDPVRPAMSATCAFVGHDALRRLKIVSRASPGS